MKDFNLEEAKAGKPVITRDGREARIVCFDRLSAGDRPIVALVSDRRGTPVLEACYTYFSDGKAARGGASELDLFMKPNRVKLFMNVYLDDENDDSSDGYQNGHGYAYPSRKLADAAAGANRVACIEIDTKV